MPTSLRDNDVDVRNYVRAHDLRTALDVGAGSGTYGHLLTDLMESIVAVEVWQPNVEAYGLNELYEVVIVRDVRSLARNKVVWSPPFDLIIFGDILEHMTTEEGMAVWEWARTVARHGIISVPTVHWPQGEVDGNPYERHVQDCITVADYRLAFGPFDLEHLYEQTATFITEFERG